MEDITRIETTIKELLNRNAINCNNSVYGYMSKIPTVCLKCHDKNKAMVIHLGEILTILSKLKSSIQVSQYEDTLFRTLNIASTNAEQIDNLRYALNELKELKELKSKTQ